MTELAGRVALITGAARGQGACEARLFIEAGARVVLADILDTDGESVARELGDQARYVRLDVTSEADWAAAVDTAVSSYGKLDALVNNAGIMIAGTVQDTSLADYLRVIQINQVGVFLGMRAAAPAIMAAGGGTIVNTSSTSGLVGIAGTVSYTASKHAVLAMTRVAAIELGPKVRVNAVCPGGVDTPMNRAAGEGMGVEAAADPHAAFPLGRIGQPEEIARLVLFLTSEDSSYCTGTEIVADGGMLAGVLEN
jgi:3alpha(or 20beta)-hydroxysteroid dehydrogenase